MHRPLQSLALLAVTPLIVACGTAPDATSSMPIHDSHGSANLSMAENPPGQVMRDIARLRERTAPFHRFEEAQKAGWGKQLTPCFSDPKAGGMGYHYANEALIDGKVDALEPELLLYEPQKNGKLQFVAVEYIVPIDKWTAAEPPSLFGQSFHRNEAFGLWVLHVWHEQHNKSGMFADWNPDVSCKYAGP